MLAFVASALASPEALAAPNLRLKDLVAPTSAPKGAFVTFAVTVENIGDAPSQTTTLTLQLGGRFIYGQPVGPVDRAGGPNPNFFRIESAAQIPSDVTTGPSNLRFRVDPQLATEPPTSEQDNVLERPFTISSSSPHEPPATGTPDLEAFELQAPPSVAVGATIPMTVSVRNLADAGSQQAPVGFFVKNPNGPELFQVGGSSVPPRTKNDPPFRASGQCSFQNVPAGTYILIAKVEAIGESPSTTANNKVERRDFAVTQAQVSQPNLVIVTGSLSASPTATAGQRLQVSGAVRNVGSANAGSYQVKFALSSDNIPDSGDRLLEPALARGPLASQGTTTFTTQLNIPADVTPSSYFVIAKADFGATVAESNENDNTGVTASPTQIQAAPNAAQRPDLLSDSAGFTSQTTPAPNSTIGLFATVRNGGSAPSPAYSIQFFLSSDAIFNPPSPSGGDRPISEKRRGFPLASQASDTLTTSGRLPQDVTPGDYFVIVAVDVNLEVTESNETNNFRASTAKLVVPQPPNQGAQPDLQPQGLSVATTAAAGRPFRIDAQVRNNGAAPAAGPNASEGYGVQLFLSSDNKFDSPGGTTAGDTFLTTLHRPALAANGFDTFTTSPPLPNFVAPGEYHVIINVDPFARIAESNETNNGLVSLTRTLVAGTQASLNLIAVSASPESTAVVGGVLGLGAVVRNDGDSLPNGYQVKFYLSTDKRFDAPTSAGGDRPLGEAVQRGPLPSQGIDQITQGLPIPLNTPVGDYFLIMAVDPANLLAERLETDNVIASDNFVSIRSNEPPPAGMPDLVALSTSASTPVTAGGSIELGITVRNATATAAGSFAVSWNLEPVPRPGEPAASPVFLADRRFASLAGNTQFTTRIVTFVPPSLAGEFILRADVDYQRQVPEGDESNNSVRGQGTILVTQTVTNPGTQQSDLVVTLVGGPSSAFIGHPYPFNATVKNVGAARSGTFKVSFGFSVGQFPPSNGARPYPRPVGDTLVGPLEPGQSIDVFVSTTVPQDLTPGTYYPAAGADDPPQVPESVESNNYAVGRAAVSLQTDGNSGDNSPDLFAAGVGTGSARVQPGQSIVVRYSLRNIGAAPAGGYHIGFVLDQGATAVGTTAAPIFLREIPGPQLAAGQDATLEVTATVSPNTAPGFYVLRMDLDPKQAVREVNEFNNTRFSDTALEVGSATQPVDVPNLVASALQAPTAATLGTTVEASVQVNNAGQGKAGPFSIGFHFIQDAQPNTAGGGFFLGEIRAHNGLAASAGSRFGARFFLPPFLAPGAYKLTAFADQGEEVRESNEGDNRALAPAATQISGNGGSTELPNLTAVSVRGPTTAAAERPFDVVGHVVNTGDGFSPGFGTAFALTNDLDNVDDDASTPGSTSFIFLGTAYTPEGLAPGSSREVRGQFQLPAAVAPGQYLLVMKADDGDRVVETDEEDNKTIQPSQVTVFGGGSSLDLVAGNLTAPTGAVIGSDLAVTANFIVRANTNPIRVPIYFYFNSPAFEYAAFRTFVEVPANPSNTDTPVSTAVSFKAPPLPLPAPGTNGNEYLMVFALDPQFTIQEPHHNNRSPGVRIAFSGGTGSQRPNLVAEFVADPPPTLAPGTLLGASGRVRNNTAVDVFRPFGITFHLIQEQDLQTNFAAPPIFFLGRASLEKLGANSAATVGGQYQLPGFLRPGRYKVGMKVDEENFVDETNEGDNFRVSNAPTQIGTADARVTDLVALGVAGPQTLELGKPAQVVGEIANRGSNDAPGFPVSFVLAGSPDIAFDSPLFGLEFVPSLSAGQTRRLTATYPVPFYLRPGAYYLGMIVDSGNFVPEIDERNNVARSPFASIVQAAQTGGFLADLAAVSVTGRAHEDEANEAEPGDEILVSGEVQNLTTQPVPVDFRVAFFATRNQILGDEFTSGIASGGFDIGSEIVHGIGAEETREVRLATRVPPFVRPGDYFIGMFVDPDRRIPELEETRANNKVLSLDPLTVTTPDELLGLPDLVAVNVVGAAAGTAGTPYNIRWAVRGDNLQRRVGFGVVFLARPNDPTAIGGERGVNILADGRVQQYIAIGRAQAVLEPGPASALVTSTSVKLPGDLPAGTYAIAMAVDPDGAIPEIETQNNFTENPNPVQIAAGAQQVDDHPDQQLLVRDPEDRIGFDASGEIQPKAGDGDRDWLFFDGEQDRFYLVLFELGSLVSADVQIVDRNGRILRRDLATGQGSKLSFRAPTSGRYWVQVAPTFRFQTGSYRLRVESFQEDSGRPDLLPGPVSVTPIVATSSSLLTAHFSIGNGGAVAAGPFAWELRVEEHVEAADNLLFRPVAQSTIIATGTFSGLAPFAARPVEPVRFGPLPDGKYDIVLTVDTAGQVDESDEGNNSRPSFFLIGRPGFGDFDQRLDLVPAGISTDPQKATTASNISARLAVANRGGLPATTFAVSVFLDRTPASPGTQLATYVVEHLAPDSVKPLPPVTIGRLSEGQHNVVMVVDSGDAVLEDVEQNNTRLHEFYVRGAVPAGYDLVPERAAVLPEFPTTGTPVALGIFIANRGAENSPPALVRVFVDPVISADGTIASPPTTAVELESIEGTRGRRVGPVPLPPFATTGKHQIVVRVDSSDASRIEANTSNNQVTIEVGVAERRLGSAFFRIAGLVLDSAGAPAEDGYRVRAFNRARRARSSESTTPESASVAGSYTVTFGQPDSTKFKVFEGDEIEFRIVSPSGEKLPVAEPASIVLSAGNILAGRLDVDLHLSPPVKVGVMVEIQKPDANASFLSDESIVFEGSATDANGMRLTGTQLSWTSGNLFIGIGESFATTLPAGQHEIRLTATASDGSTAFATRAIEVSAPEVPAISTLTILGTLKSTSNGEAPDTTLTLKITNATRGLEGTDVVDASGDGAYRIDFTDPDAVVAEPGDKWEVTLTDAAGTAIPVSPSNFSIGTSDLLAGQHERDFRVHFEAPEVVQYYQGTNLLSVPLQPFTSDETEYDSEDLARDLGVTFMVRVVLDEDGEPQFETYMVGLTPAFPITGNEAYIVNLPADRVITWTGTQWGTEGVDVKLTRGLNSISNALDVPDGLTVRQILETFNAKLAFAVIDKGNSTSFKLLGDGYSDLDEVLDDIKLFVISPVDTPVEVPAVE